MVVGRAGSPRRCMRPPCGRFYEIRLFLDLWGSVTLSVSIFLPWGARIPDRCGSGADPKRAASGGAGLLNPLNEIFFALPRYACVLKRQPSGKSASRSSL